MLPWGGEVAKKLSLLEQGGSMWGVQDSELMGG